MNDFSGDKATAFPARELVFEWRPPHQQYRKSTAQLVMIWVMAGLTLLALAFSFWLLRDGHTGHRELAAKWKALIMSDQMMMAAVLFGKLLIYCTIAALPLWVQHRQRHSRLYLNSATLRHRSGLPLWLGNLLKQNWTLSLDDFRSGRLVFMPSSQAQGYSPLARYTLRWTNAQGKTHGLMAVQQLTPVSWFLVGQTAREPIKMPPGLLWHTNTLNPLSSPKVLAVLQDAFDQLPLVAALRAQGIALPPLSSFKPAGLGDVGFDLMAYPRMKAVVLGFFGLLASAALAYHFMRHQHFFETPPLWTWVAVGAGCALVAWVWMAAEQPPPGEPSFRPTEGVLALLLGLASALLAPSALLALNQALAPAQSISVTISHSPLRLEPEDARIPAFRPSQALDFWASLPAKSTHPLTVRQGLFGTWQYDSRPLEDEVRAFYLQHDGR